MFRPSHKSAYFGVDICAWCCLLKFNHIHECCSLVLFQLLGTVLESTTDVDGLHAKLDRKRSVEQHNEGTQAEFEQCFTSNIEGMKQSLQSFTEGQLELNQQIRHNLGKTERCQYTGLLT